MFIQTENTPNPNVLKFIPGRDVLPGQTLDFRDAESARLSPLAARLFETDGITGVFLGSDFISITKTPEKDWIILKPRILAAIMEHFTTNQPILAETTRYEDKAATGLRRASEDDPVVQQIKELLEVRVRPAVAQDGGDIVFHDFDQGIVYLEMRGACAGCPSSTATLKAGVENMLRHYIPEVEEVRAV